MRSFRRVPSALAFVVATLAASGSVDGAESTASLSDQLANNGDFRVRVSAALKLGQGDDPKAVQPLCKCLADKTETEAVRVACAAGLGKLKRPGSDTCLAGATGDKNKKVAEQANTSLKALGSGPTTVSIVGTTGGTTGALGTTPCAEPPAKGKPKYYVGIDLKNKTTRSDDDIRAVVVKELRCQLLGIGGRFTIADDLDPKKMMAAAAKSKLEGWYVTVEVEPIKSAKGKLDVTMKLLIMTPDRTLKGELDKWMSMSGPKLTKADEDDLLRRAAKWLAERFAETKS